MFSSAANLAARREVGKLELLQGHGHLRVMQVSRVSVQHRHAELLQCQSLGECGSGIRLSDVSIRLNREGLIEFWRRGGTQGPTWLRLSRYRGRRSLPSFWRFPVPSAVPGFAAAVPLPPAPAPVWLVWGNVGSSPGLAALVPGGTRPRKAVPATPPSPQFLAD